MRVKIGEYLRAVPRQDDVCSHHFYKKIMTLMGPDWEKETLQDVEEYKIELSKELYIQTFLPRIQVIRSSIAFVFSIPHWIPIDFVKLEPFFHHIKVYINDSCLIDWMKERYTGPQYIPTDPTDPPTSPSTFSTIKPHPKYSLLSRLTHRTDPPTTIEQLSEFRKDALRDLKSLLLRRASFSISQFSSSRESKGIILTVNPHTEERVVTGKTPEVSRALEKVTEDLLIIKNMGRQSYDPRAHLSRSYKISEHLTNSMKKYIDIRRGSMKDRKHAYSKLIHEDIAFIKKTQGHIMSSKPDTSFRGYTHYIYPHQLELLLDIEQKTFRMELKYYQELSREVLGIEVEKCKKMRDMLGTQREMLKTEQLEMEKKMEIEMIKLEVEMEKKIEKREREIEKSRMERQEVYQEILIKELHRVAQEQLDYNKWDPLGRITDVEFVIQRMIVIEDRIKIM